MTLYRPRKLHMYVGYYDDVRLGMVLAESKQAARGIIGTNKDDFDANWIKRDDLPEGIVLKTNRLYTRFKSELTDVPWTLGVCGIWLLDTPPATE